MKYDWSKMSPRERDVLVAEKVMGRKLFNSKPFSLKLNLRVDMGFVGSTDLPHYTTDIAAAWEVVEWIKQDGGGSIHIFTYDGHGPEETEILIDGQERCKGDFPVAEAICLAALRAKGVDV